jgi:hypothetical protein
MTMSRLTYVARVGYLVAAWLFVLAVVATVFVAGMSLFVGSTFWPAHMDFGYNVGLLVPVLIVLALLARLPRSHVPLLVLLIVIYVVQTLLPPLRASVPLAAALHPVNAMLVFLTAVVHARRARELLQTLPSPARVAG